jgi:16S rRNA (guanine527-N7)-methyltransferase
VPSRTATSSSDRSDPRLERWLAALVSTPGLTAHGELEAARREHVLDALAAAPFVESGPVVDVGSGGGSPGIPLAIARPDLEFVLLEARRRKCAFLESATTELPNARVLCARAEDHARGAGRDAYATALARALAPPPVAAEWCLPLVALGGLLILYTGEPAVEEVAAVADRLGGSSPTAVPVTGSERRHLVLVRKTAPTPPEFPRRPGLARKRPLA